MYLLDFPTWVVICKLVLLVNTWVRKRWFISFCNISTGLDVQSVHESGARHVPNVSPGRQVVQGEWQNDM